MGKEGYHIVDCNQLHRKIFSWKKYQSGDLKCWIKGHYYQLVWMLTVNGFAVDIRNMPMELQEEAFERGLIPFIPGRKSSWISVCAIRFFWTVNPVLTGQWIRKLLDSIFPQFFLPWALVPSVQFRVYLTTVFASNLLSSRMLFDVHCEPVDQVQHPLWLDHR